MFGSCGQIKDWSGRKGWNFICNPSKLSITSYFNNVKPMKHLHLVFLVHCSPNFTHFMINQVSDCGKTNFLLYVIKKIWPLTTKTSMPIQTICWSWRSSWRTFTNFCGLCWLISCKILPLSLGTSSPNLIGNLGIVNFNGTTINATNLEHSFKVSIWWVCST